MDNWTVSDVTGHSGVIGQYLANAIISDKSASNDNRITLGIVPFYSAHVSITFTLINNMRKL